MEERTTLAPGMQVTPTVLLLRPLSTGGMGAVWLADHTGLKTQVVVKFMLGELGSSQSARTRFEREAAAAAKVKSPHVVQMLDHGLTSDGVPFIVMEHLEGKDLGAHLSSHPDGRLPPRDVAIIVNQIAKALTKVHAAGLLHRDIKPDNIFLVEGEEDLFAKLLDFGIAKSHVHGEKETTLDGETKTGQVVGTPFYMSPEQVTAQKNIDARADVWALGVVAFEALTGKRPYDGPSFGALAVRIATGEPPKPTEANADLPPAIDAWFAKACARDPNGRYASAKELADGLRQALADVIPASELGAFSGSGDRRLSDSGPKGSVPPRAFTPSRSATTPRPSDSNPIAVDADAGSRPSFVLASTLEQPDTSKPPPSMLARSASGMAIGAEPTRRGPPALAYAFVALLGVAGVGLFVAFRKEGPPPAPSATSSAVTREPGAAPAKLEAPSASVAPVPSTTATPDAAVASTTPSATTRPTAAVRPTPPPPKPSATTSAPRATNPGGDPLY
ncbi:MAG TPA: protein kinase [Labilithrix sp.]